MDSIHIIVPFKVDYDYSSAAQSAFLKNDKQHLSNIQNIFPYSIFDTHAPYNFRACDCRLLFHIVRKAFSSSEMLVSSFSMMPIQSKYYSILRLPSVSPRGAILRCPLLKQDSPTSFSVLSVFLLLILTLLSVPMRSNFPDKFITFVLLQQLLGFYITLHDLEIVGNLQACASAEAKVWQKTFLTNKRFLFVNKKTLYCAFMELKDSLDLYVFTSSNL